ncbi:MAG: low-specificity L-threonine aldolase [Spirochaetota bacterium]
MSVIDLRSDTTTKPTEAMRNAMAQAEVGDDVYREDPTVNQLEQTAAEITGKEASLFVTSGSMGNLIALYLLGGRGNQVLTHRDSHIIGHEVASPAAIAGVLPIGLDGERGLLSVQEIERHLHPEDYTVSSTTLIEVENTMNGTCYPLERLQEIRRCADSHNLLVHMDGARVFNAAAKQEVPVSEICQYADSVSFCLSKGLGTPAGSMLCGTKEFIGKALKVRKMLGGGMRQVGILAAAGNYALEHHVKRLREDHDHARLIAEALAQTSWARISPDEVETNIIFVETPDIPAEAVVRALQEKQILCFAMGAHTLRLVTHLNISPADAQRVAEVVGSLSFS